MLEITYKSAFFLTHRIREAMDGTPFAEKLKGIVEVDETYVGGKSKGFGGRSTKKKTAVVALIQRDGPMRSMPVPRASAQELQGAILNNVERDSAIYTDEWSGYKGIGKAFKGGHQTVNHGRYEYARGNVSVNSAESYFALFKRGVMGTFHHISRNHMNRYCQEFSYRWNTRKISDFDRFVGAVKGGEGKRLMYSVVN